MYDIIVVGGGPAGMTAALYAAREGRSVLVIEKETFGGQITYSPRVENFPGTLQMSGNEFAERLLDQILQQGVEIEIDTVTGVEDMTSVFGTFKIINTEHKGYRAYEARTVILANGVKHRRMGLEHEEELIGQRIHFCAVCDGDFYEDKVVAVIGGGNSALQEAVLLSEKCEDVIIIQDLPELTGEQKLQDILKSKENVRIFTNQEVVKLDLNPDEHVDTSIQIKNKTSGLLNRIYCDGIFVAIGLIPDNERFINVANLNQQGYFNAEESCTTFTHGVYVAGDCRQKSTRQLTTAVADGAVAALAACSYLRNLDVLR